MTYTIVIFGANGDLAKKKICPALKELKSKYALKIIGIDRNFDNDYQSICNQVDHLIIGDLKTNAVYENLQKIILENDFPTLEQKEAVDGIFIQNGFKNIYSDSLQIPEFRKRFPYHDYFFQVWKKE